LRLSVVVVMQVCKTGKIRKSEESCASLLWLWARNVRNVVSALLILWYVFLCSFFLGLAIKVASIQDHK